MGRTVPVKPNHAHRLRQFSRSNRPASFDLQTVRFRCLCALGVPPAEEPGLRARFGDDYRVYSQHVGRWIPRLKPWQQPDGVEL